MTCREFEWKFNELIDGEREVSVGGRGAIANRPMPGVGGLERALLDHAERCPDCRRVAARYQLLRRAIGAWHSPPVVPADLADRILAADAEAPASSAWAVGECKPERWGPLIVTYSSILAASILMAVVFRWFAGHERANRPTLPSPSVAIADRLHSVGSSSSAPIAGSRALNRALAEATSATLDLARFASEPAARISQQVLDAASNSAARMAEAGIAGRERGGGMPTPAFDSLAPDAGAMFQEVGDRLAAGVAPLSKSARRAFGFLLGPGPNKLDSRHTTPAAKGA